MALLIQALEASVHHLIGMVLGHYIQVGRFLLADAFVYWPERLLVVCFILISLGLVGIRAKGLNLHHSDSVHTA